MKAFLNILTGLGAALLLLALLSCTKAPQPSSPSKPAQEKQEGKTEEKEDEKDTDEKDTEEKTDTEEKEMPGQIKITISGTTLPIVIENNVATKALVEALEKGPVTYTASDYGGFEKVGALGFSLPTDNSQITTQAGDVILYNGDNIVLFYGSNSWSYTRLGRIKYSSLSELKSFLKAGGGEISVTLSL